MIQIQKKYLVDYFFVLLQIDDMVLQLILEKEITLRQEWAASKENKTRVLLSFLPGDFRL